MISGLAHVCIASPDLAATARFYCEVLGFEKAFDFRRKEEVVGFYLKTGEGSFIEVFRQEEIDGGETAPIRHLCFEVDDVDAVSRRLRSAGCPVTEKELGSDQSWQIWTSDPGGVRIEFHQYGPESSQRTGRDCVLD